MINKMIEKIGENLFKATVELPGSVSTDMVFADERIFELLKTGNFKGELYNTINYPIYGRASFIERMTSIELKNTIIKIINISKTENKNFIEVIFYFTNTQCIIDLNNIEEHLQNYAIVPRVIFSMYPKLITFDLRYIETVKSPYSIKKEEAIKAIERIEYRMSHLTDDVKDLEIAIEALEKYI